MLNLCENYPHDEIDSIIKLSDNKNIIYLNKPKDLEDISFKLTKRLRKINNSAVKKASKDLKDYVHEDYKLAEILEYGVLYHHGSVPDPVRYFLEDLYARMPELKMLIANSTLLEGVNIPATKMFILSPSRGSGYMSPSAFKNLIGRICRFGEIFDPEDGSLDYLLPEIHIFKGEYARENMNIKNLIRRLNILVHDEIKIRDEVKNPLLENSKPPEDDLNKSIEILENISPNDTINDSYSKKPVTKIGELCFKYNIDIFDILTVEKELENKIKGFEKVNDLDSIFTLLSNVFLSTISDDRDKNENIKRLVNIEAQKFYSMLIKWRIKGTKFNTMIEHIVSYWNKLDTDNKQNVYVGRWGNKTNNGFRTYWIDITNMTNSELINLAIVRLKEEYDFIDYDIIKYIDIIYDLELIDEEIYLKIKYGTDDKNKISLLNCGISRQLTDRLINNYSSKYYSIDTINNVVTFNQQIIEKMKENNENGIYVTEVYLNTKAK